MSSNKPESVKEWLLENYPVEAVFIDEITKNVNEIFQRYGLIELNQKETKNLLFQVTKRQETDYPEFAVNELATTLFLGGMAKAISNIIVTKFLPELSTNTKECLKCGERSNELVNYCHVCGYKFEKK